MSDGTGVDASEPSFTRKEVTTGELAGNPRYQVFEFRSAILVDPPQRDVMVYLPPQYELESQRRFPALYLHDGQNLFDGLTSYIPGHTWRAGTIANELATTDEMEPVILVGVANTGLRRMADYTPTRDFKMGGGDGQIYGRLLMEEVKPWVDRTYRTKPEGESTGLGGSSLGGLISLYLGLERPDVFGRLAVMSPSLWWDQRSIFRLIEEAKPGPRIWLDMGTAEGARHLRDTDALYKLLLRRGWQAGVDVKYMKAPGAIHNEDAWALRFGEALRFLFPSKL